MKSMFEFLEFDTFSTAGNENVMKTLLWIVQSLCVLQVIIKTVTNTEYIKTTEFVEVEKSAGPESVSGFNLPEGPGKRGPTEYSKPTFIHDKYILRIT